MAPIKTMILPFVPVVVFIARQVTMAPGGNMKHMNLLALTALTIGLMACGPKVQTAADLSSLSQASSETQFIVGGEAVTANEQVAKSTVALSHKLYGVFCTGTLIAKNLVLTAGHCTGVARDPRQFQVVFALAPGSAGAAQTRQVLGGKTTDAWPKVTQNQPKNWGDIAVLRFEGTLPAGYEPAVLLGNPTLLQDNMDVILAGYGLTSMQPEIDPGKLMEATVKLTESKFSETEIRFGQENGKGACHGDSGGPAYTMIKGRLNLIGVTSRSATEAGGRTCSEGAIYTSVAAHKDFLIATAKFLNSKDFKLGQPIPQPQ